MKDTKQLCQEILLKIIEICNEVPRHHMEHECVSFQSDFGGMSLTGILPTTHFHVGQKDGTFEDLIKELHNALQA